MHVRWKLSKTNVVFLSVYTSFVYPSLCPAYLSLHTYVLIYSQTVNQFLLDLSVTLYTTGKSI